MFDYLSTGNNKTSFNLKHVSSAKSKIFKGHLKKKQMIECYLHYLRTDSRPCIKYNLLMINLRDRLLITSIRIQNTSVGLCE